MMDWLSSTDVDKSYKEEIISNRVFEREKKYLSTLKKKLARPMRE
jgi:hypothetical protein